MIIPIYDIKQSDSLAVDPWQKRLAKRLHICPFCTPETRMAIHFGNNPYDTWSFCPKCEAVSYVWDDSSGRRRIHSTHAEYLPKEVKALINYEISGLELAMQRYSRREEQKNIP